MYNQSGHLPESLATKPDMHSWMIEYFGAFKLLSSRRQVGMVANPISLVDIQAYINLYGATDLREFVEFITMMDSTYLKYLSDKASKDDS